MGQVNSGHRQGNRLRNFLVILLSLAYIFETKHYLKIKFD